MAATSARPSALFTELLRLGPVQGDHPHAPMGLGQDLVGHAVLPIYLGGMRMPPSTRSVSPFM